MAVMGDSERYAITISKLIQVTISNNHLNQYMQLNRGNIVQRQCQLSVSHVGKEKNDVMYCVLGN